MGSYCGFHRLLGTGMENKLLLTSGRGSESKTGTEARDAAAVRKADEQLRRYTAQENMAIVFQWL